MIGCTVGKVVDLDVPQTEATLNYNTVINRLESKVEHKNGIGLELDGKNDKCRLYNNPEVICNLCQADVDPLIINVSLDAGKTFLDCMVDTGAGVSLLSEGVLPTLHNIDLKPSKEVTAIMGFGHNHRIPVTFYIEEQVVFDSGFTTNPIKFFIIPLEVMNHNAILGAVALKDNKLLPDLTRRELLKRTQDSLTSVGKDISLTIPFYNCLIPEFTIIPPYQCKMVKIAIPSCNKNSYKNRLVEFSGVSHSSLNFLPGILDISVKEVLIAVLNPSEKEQHVRKNFIVGSISDLGSRDGQVCIQQGTPEFTLIDPEVYWDVEKIKLEFEISTLPLSTDQQEKLISILLKYPHVLSTGDNDVGLAQNITHTIELETDKPVRIPVRRFHGPLAQEIEKECADLLESGIIQYSKSPYSAPVVPVRKPDGSLRLCIDYRKLNNVTKGDSFPLPNLIDMIYNMHGNSLFTTIDLIKGYYQIGMDADSIEKTAFSTPFGQYEYTKMPFGVKNGPATFQRGMMIALAGLPWNKVMVYLDDIIILGKNFEDHLDTLEKVLIALGSNGYKLKPKKTRICRTEVEFLGHRISEKGIQPLEKNLRGALEFPVPTTVKQLRQFLGMVNFYRRHIPNCSQIAQPLSSQTGGKTVTWTEGCQNAFTQLKEALVNPTLLGFPNYSPEASPLELYVDASNLGAGACLSQKQNGVQRPIAYISTTFSGPQKNYSTIDKELTALRWAVKSLKAFLKGVKFVIYTDHQPLIYLQNMSMVDGRVARTWEELNNYDFEIRHIVGKVNIIADALSRSPVLDQSYGDTSEMNPKSIEFIPVGFELIEVPGGADSVFRWFSLYLYGSMENHLEIRVAVVEELLKNLERYKLQEKGIRKRIRVMKCTGQVPVPEVIDSFCNIYKTRIEIYYDDERPMIYGSQFTNNICRLKCLGGIHYNYLQPIEIVQTKTNEIIININEVIPLYDDLNIAQNNIREVDIIFDQNNDYVLRNLSKHVSLNTPSSIWPPLLKIYKCHHRDLFIQNDMLYRYQHQQHKQHKQIVLSFNFLVLIVLKLHWNLAHIGRNKILDLIYRHFWNPRANQVVSDVVRCCPTCQKLKTHSSKVIPPTLKIKTNTPFDLVAMDLLQFPVTNSGNKYVTVLIDHCSKWVSVIPIADKQSVTVAEALENRILPFLPKLPNRLLTDNGMEFVAETFQIVLERFNIQHIRTSPLHPASNGICERFNRSLIQLLRCLVLENESNWDEELSSAVIIYNHTWHSSIKMSPSDFILKESHVEPAHTFPQYWDDGTPNFKPYIIGQRVAKKIIFKGHQATNKFRVRWEGPFVITVVNDNKVTYRIKRVANPNSREEKVHYSHLRKWIEIPSYLLKNPFFKEKVFQAEEEEEEDTLIDVELEYRSDDEREEVDEDKPSSDDDIDSEGEEDDFEGFGESDSSEIKTSVLAQMVQTLRNFQSVSDVSCTDGTKELVNSEISSQDNFRAEVNPFSISPILSVPCCTPNETVSPLNILSFSVANDLCTSVYSGDFKHARWTTWLENNESEEKSNRAEMDSKYKSLNFSGFESHTIRWDAVEITNDQILDRVFSPFAQIMDIPELEWDDSSLMIDELGGDQQKDILESDNSKNLKKPAGLEIDTILETIEEGSLNDELEDDEVTQSPTTLLQFLAQNYQLTNISSIHKLDELSASYSLEGEVLLKKKLTRTTSETGEPVIEELPLLIVEAPVIRPFTRSRGMVSEYDRIMSTPLEWKKRK